MPVNRNISLLLVDKNRFLLRLLRQSLESLGFGTVEGVESAKEALNAFSRKSFDLIITELDLNEMNGLEMIAMIRSNTTSVRYDIPMLVLSEHEEPATVETLGIFHIAGYQVKPVKPKLLEENITRALARKGGFEKPEQYRLYAQFLDFDLERLGSSKDPLKPILASKQGDGNKAAPGKKSVTRKAEPVAQPAAENKPVQSPQPLQVDIRDLRPGMVILEPIAAKGVVLLQAGTRLNDLHMQVLRDLVVVISQLQVSVTNEAQ